MYSKLPADNVTVSLLDGDDVDGAKTGRTNELPSVGTDGIRENEAKFTRKLASARVDWLFVKRFFRIMSFSGTSLWSLPHLYLWRLIFVSIMLGLASEFMSEWVGSMGGLIAMQSYESAWELMWRGWMFSITVGIANTFLQFDANLLTWHWRKNITRDLTTKYLTDTNPFSVVYLKEYSLDNPDQRIIDDVNSLCLNTATLASSGFSSLATLVIVTYGMATKVGPIFVLISYGAGILFGVFYIFIMRPLARYSFEQDKVEGDFRYAHARIRENAESIAFFHGEAQEKKNVDSSLRKVVHISKKVAKWTIIFTMYNVFSQWLPAMGLLVSNALILWFNTGMNSSLKYKLLITGSQFSVLIMTQMCSLLRLGSNLAVVAGSVGRVSQLYEVCNHLNKYHDRRKTDFQSGKEISFDHIICDTPQHTILVKDLTVSILPGSHVLIMGPSGSGKSSLLRSIAGLWKASGTITKPDQVGSGIFYLPQKAYFVAGTLRDQVIYPDSIPKRSEEELFECLKMANIEQVHRQFEGWDATVDWATVLSPGEQQRLIFARLFYHRPTFAVLDEATSALDSKNERHMYQQCKKLNISCLSVGHRYTLLEHHQKLLYFDGKGDYEYRDIDEKDLKKAINDKQWTLEEERTGTLDLTKPLMLEEEKEQIEKVVERALEERSYFTRVKYMLNVVHEKLWGKETFMFLVVLGCCVISSLLQSSFPEITNRFIQAFLAENQYQFFLYTGAVIGAVLLLATFIPAGIAGSLYLGIYYRKHMVTKIHKQYFKNDLFLFLNTVDHQTVDNVDQRITQEVRESTTGWTVILQTIISNVLSPIMLSVFLSQNTDQGKWIVLLVWVFNIVYCFGAVVGTYFVSKYTIIQSISEGHLRFAHIKVREYAESIVFNGSECLRKEKEVIEKYFQQVLDTFWDVIFYQLLQTIWLELLSACVQAIGLILVLYFLPKVFPDGSNVPVSKISGITTSLLSSISNLMMSSITLLRVSTLIGQHSGHLTRAVQLIDRMTKREQQDNLKITNSTTSYEKRVKMDNVIVVTPTGRQLNQHGISFELDENESLIIMGPSGCGKSSILRVLSGLWTAPSGDIIRPMGHDLFFVPQKAYMVLGTLRDQVIYPYNSETFMCDDQEIIAALKHANLGYLLTRFDLNTEEIWSSVLSGGEQQRLSMARLFFHKPPYAILDESTSALDPANEELMYTKCSEFKIGYISIGHRESLMSYHHRMLLMDGKGGWQYFSGQ
eukprot:TRINITY_DN10351_c0_g1_i1.p1 TRINITY_DN10351_c0_g1~~TRINITY_DN10351_c0_g1_i1.p1  ORF type:complete len:1236 (-),score=207.20 TRINITY_DN10351_c0_g1_i1:43-3750(-)